MSALRRDRWAVQLGIAADGLRPPLNSSIVGRTAGDRIATVLSRRSPVERSTPENVWPCRGSELAVVSDMRRYSTGIGLTRFGVLVAVLTVLGSCSGSSSSATTDAGRDAARIDAARIDAARNVDEGASEDISGDVAGEGSAGDSSVDAAEQGTNTCPPAGFTTFNGKEITVPDAGPPVCVVGQYCGIQVPPGGSSAVCATFATDGPVVCAQDPTCACFCDPKRGRLPGPCGEQCGCSETNGFVTVACQGI
jgi:hypothetical protein